MLKRKKGHVTSLDSYFLDLDLSQQDLGHRGPRRVAVRRQHWPDLALPGGHHWELGRELVFQFLYVQNEDCHS